MYQLRVTGDYKEALACFLIEVLGCPSQEPNSNANALIIWQDNKAADLPIFVFVLAAPY